MINKDVLNKLSVIFDYDMLGGDLGQEIDWDSLQTISFLSFLSDQFSHAESPTVINQIQTYNGLIAYIETI